MTALAESDLRRVAPAGSQDSAARVSAGAAEIEAGQGGLVTGPAADGALKENLIGSHRAMKIITRG